MVQLYYGSFEFIRRDEALIKHAEKRRGGVKRLNGWMDRNERGWKGRSEGQIGSDDLRETLLQLIILC